MQRLAGTWGSPQTPPFRNRIKIRKLEQGNRGQIMLSREGRVAAGRENRLIPIQGHLLQLDKTLGRAKQ